MVEVCDGSDFVGVIYIDTAAAAASTLLLLLLLLMMATKKTTTTTTTTTSNMMMMLLMIMVLLTRNLIATAPPLPPATATKVPDYSQQFSILRGSVRNLLTYVGFFLAALTFSLSKPRELLLPYIPIPSIYGEGGILTWTGAAVIGGLTTVLAYILNTVLYTLF